VEIRKIRENPWLLIICLSERPNEVTGNALIIWRRSERAHGVKNWFP